MDVQTHSTLLRPNSTQTHTWPKSIYIYKDEIKSSVRKSRYLVIQVVNIWSVSSSVRPHPPNTQNGSQEKRSHRKDQWRTRGVLPIYFRFRSLPVNKPKRFSYFFIVLYFSKRRIFPTFETFSAVKLLMFVSALYICERRQYITHVQYIVNVCIYILYGFSQIKLRAIEHCYPPILYDATRVERCNFFTVNQM